MPGPGAGRCHLEPAAGYGADAVRWWLLREVPRVRNADFTVERLAAMIGRYRDGQIRRLAPNRLAQAG